METEDEGVLLADGFEEALIGLGHRFTYAVAGLCRENAPLSATTMYKLRREHAECAG